MDSNFNKITKLFLNVELIKTSVNSPQPDGFIAINIMIITWNKITKLSDMKTKHILSQVLEFKYIIYIKELNIDALINLSYYIKMLSLEKCKNQMF